MLPYERKLLIIEYLRKHRVASVSQLSKEFNVHETTIRRDLAELDKEGYLRRTHGGVVIDQWFNSEPSFNERANEQLHEKKRIGKKAAEMIEEGDHIIIDSGTTTIHIARNLINRNDITVVTNDINVAAELRNAKGVRVIVTGGILYHESYMLNGMITDQVLQSLHVRKAFVGTPAIHWKYGLTHPEAELVPTKQGMIRAAKEVFVVADHTKIGKVSLHTVASTDQFHHLITGSEAPELQIQEFNKANINVITV